MVRAVNQTPFHFRPKLCFRISYDCKMSGKQFKPAVTELRSMDIWRPSSKPSWCGRRRVRQSSALYRALHLRGHKSVREPEPFAAVILCTSDPDKVDDRTRSKWSRVLRYAAEFKDLDESLRDFIKRKGGHQRMCGAVCVVALGD